VEQLVDDATQERHARRREHDVVHVQKQVRGVGAPP
jgi:hypothetical protein